MKKSAFLAVILFVTLGECVAQIRVSEYCSEVADYSYMLSSGYFAVHGAEADVKRAKKGYLPILESSRDMEYSFQKDADGRRFNWFMRPQIVQPIYDGGAVRAAHKQAVEQYKIAENNKHQAELDVRYTAEECYWKLSEAEIYLKAIGDYLDIINSLREVVSNRYDEGYIAKNDLLQVDSRLSDARYQLSAAEQRYLVALHRFNVMRGAAPDQSVELAESILDTMAMPMRAEFDRVLHSRPDYHSSIARSEHARWGIRAATAPFEPSINVGLYALLGPKSQKIEATRASLNGGIVFGFHTPIFHFRERRDAARSARAKHRIAELAVGELTDAILLEESDGWTNLQNSHSRVETTRRNLALAKETLDIITFSYEEGLTTILDVLQAQISWLQIYSNAIAAQYDYAIAISEYRRITVADE